MSSIPFHQLFSVFNRATNYHTKFPRLSELERVLIRQPNGNTCNKKYEIKGIFHDNCLVMTYEVSDNTRFGLGACVFRLVNDGKKLDGEWTAIDASSSMVFSKKEHWLRKSR